MKSLPEWTLALSLVVALVSLAWAVRAVYPERSTSLKWQRGCCITGLALGGISWLSAIGIIVIAGLRADALGPLIPGLLLFGMFTTPVALVMGIATKAKPAFSLSPLRQRKGCFGSLFGCGPGKACS